MPKGSPHHLRAFSSYWQAYASDKEASESPKDQWSEETIGSGIMAAAIHKPGTVGIVSRSGTLTYEVAAALTGLGIGQSTSIGIGGDPIIGTNFIDVLQMFQNDPKTEAIVMIGEIGGTDELEAADFIKSNVTKPVVGFIAGQSAPPNKRMGHAGAIVSGGTGTAAEKMEHLRQAGAHVAEDPTKIAQMIADVMPARS